MTRRAPILQKSWARPFFGGAPVTQRSTTLLSGPQLMPFRQQDWPRPIAPSRIDYAPVVQVFRGVPAVVAALPFNQKDWPLPHSVQTYSVSISVNIALAGGGKKPFAQYDWPLPVRSLRVDYAPVVQRSEALVSHTVQMPFNLYDWPRKRVYL